MAFLVLDEPMAAADDRDATQVREAQRDPAAFAPLYEAYVLPVYGYCLRMLRDTQAASDATSETFLKALRALPGYRAKSFRAWLFTIARNVAIDIIRSRRPMAGMDAAGELADREPTPEERLLARESDLRVRDLLARLNGVQAQVLELRIAGLTSREIADVLGCSTGAVRIAQFRALKRLQAWLSDPHAEAEYGER